jgi:addiction module RelB/DinJ family antitoxin
MGYTLATITKKTMSKTAMIRARIEPDLKEKGEKALKQMGITASQAITIFYTQIVIQKKLPFEMRLEAGDIPENYIRVKNEKHFKKLIGLKDVPNRNTSGRNKSSAKDSFKNKAKSKSLQKPSNPKRHK